VTETPLTDLARPGQEPLNLADYQREGGYRAARKAVLEMAPGEVTQLVKDAGLRGRGGAGFPTGMKWSFVPSGDNARHPTYLIANADEMEPGTFKDRFLIEETPHQLIEAMIIAAWAIQADVAWIFLRWEYRLCERRLRRAIAEATESGFLGTDVFGSGWRLDMHLHISSGRYMCGEETGLLNALEGKRATPRQKPPFPQVSGLWGKPTIVQNVETLCNLPHIVNNGADWYQGLGVGDNAGTKLYGASGKVAKPGLWELPLGTALRELLFEHAGGMRDGLGFRGLLPGGASTDFLVEQHLDTPMDYDHVAKAGSRLGTGMLIVLDDHTCPVGMVHNLELFFAQESCGWCTPCREGLPWVADMLGALERGEGRQEDLATLAEQCDFLAPGRTFCALAPGAVEPLQSALRYFADDFARHVSEQRCPWGES
jgi:NADH-quinone oxidoreductase subunit F